MAGGGSQKTKTSNEPWGGTKGSLSGASFQLENRFSDVLNAGAPGLNAYTQNSWDRLRDQVGDGNSLLNQGLGLAQQTVNGAFLNSNPYINQAYQSAADAATRAYNGAIDPSMRAYQSQMDQNLQNYQSQLGQNLQNYQSGLASGLSQWQNAISPGIDAQFAAGGRLGSGLFANARNAGEENVARQFSDLQSNTARQFSDTQQNTARMFAGAQSDMAQYQADQADALARNLTNTAGQMYYSNYNDERARQNAAMTAAPSLAVLPAGIMQQIGQQQSDYDSMVQNYGWDLAKQYAQSAGGLQSGFGTSTTKAPGQNPWLQALGLGLQGASMFI